MNRRAVFCAALIALTAIGGSLHPAKAHSPRHRDVLAPTAPALTARREGTRLYLVEGRERLLLRDEAEAQSTLWRGPQEFTLANGSVILVLDTDVVVYKGDKKVGTIAMDAKMKRWLADDTFWKNPDEANQMRHRHPQGAAFQFTIDDIVLEADSLLGVLGWVDLMDLGEPVRAQQLIRIHTASNPTLEVVRHLKPNPVAAPKTVPHRLFTLGKRLLLYDRNPRNQLTEITPNGKDKQVVAVFPKELYPVGIVEKRWALLRTWADETAHPLHLYDLRAAKTTVLPSGFRKGYPDNIVLPQSGHYILVRKDGGANKDRRAVVSIPDGKLVHLPAVEDNGAAFVWRDKVIFIHNNGFKDSIPRLLLIYSAATGKLVKRLRVPSN